MKHRLPVFLIAALAGATGASLIFLALSGAGGSAKKSSPSAVLSTTRGTGGGTRREVSTGTPTATQIYKQDSSGVVSIKATTAQGGDSGTGIVLNEEGLILTNDHVISEGTSLTVSPGKSSNLTRTATVVGADPNQDLALIKVDPSGLGLKALKLVSSSSVEVGDPVYAIGNPYGLNETLTRGIVSALGREIQAPDGAPIKDAIQTDAALNPGNSGGPLLNEQGEVIGVNSQIASDAATAEGSQPGSTGVGFAISSNTVSEAIKTIESGGGSSSGSGQTESGAGAEERSGSETQQGTQSPSESPYGGSGEGGQAESPYGFEGGQVESRRGEGGAGRSEGVEASPYGYGQGSGTEAEGQGVSGAGAGETGREGQVVVVP
ncbi:MAG: trypsin-like peptidase domain-containing protein [Solirubrobacteraceae bacterium]